MRVYVESYGCAQNRGEAHEIERQLHAAGHSLAGSEREADAGVLVTCGVIGTTEARMTRRWEALTRALPQVIVTGCLVPLRSDALTGPGRERTRFVPIRQQMLIPQLLGGTEPVGAAPPAAAGPPVRVAEEVVIAQGCTSACSYCLSRLARGRLDSVSLPGVVAAVRARVQGGAREIRLTGLDTSCWGAERTLGPRLPDLVRAVATVPGEFRIRVGMMSPQSLAEIAGAYFDELAEPKMFQFLHLPVQSGSDPVLTAMHRGYSAAQFTDLVAAARTRLPEVTVATDVITGYPTELESDHEATIRLVESTVPEIVNVTRFSPRPGTPAARLPPVRSAVAKRRSRELAEVHARTARRRLERWIGWSGTALVTEHGPDRSSVVRTASYLPVVLPEREPLGSRVDVAVHGARTTYLLGNVVGRATPIPA